MSISTTNELFGLKSNQSIYLIFYIHANLKHLSSPAFPSSSEANNSLQETLAQPHSTAFLHLKMMVATDRRLVFVGCLQPRKMPRYRFNCPITRSVAVTTPAPPPPPQIHACLFISPSCPSPPPPHSARTNSRVVAVGFFFFTPPLPLSSCLFTVGELRLERRR